MPNGFEEELIKITDYKLSEQFYGFQITTDDFARLLAIKYPQIPQLLATGEGVNPIELIFASPLSVEQESQIRDLFSGVLPDWPLALKSEEKAEIKKRDIIQEEQIYSKTGGNADLVSIVPSVHRLNAPNFVRLDEEYWSENVDNIFRGQIRPNSIMDFEKIGSSCLIDASVHSQIDLRQALLAFDTIFLIPPLNGHFWDSQPLGKEAVLRMVEAGRLRLVLVQPEERTDHKFLEAVYERNPQAVMGRLKSAAFVASDIVQTCDEYILANKNIEKSVSILIRAFSEKMNLPIGTISKLLLWPLHARRTCLMPFFQRGLIGIDAISLGRVLNDEFKTFKEQDFLLESLSAAQGVHIAHSLRATLIPPTEDFADGWLWPRRIIGDRLNMYRSLNGRIAASWAGNEMRKVSGPRIIPAIPLFAFNRHAPIDDVLEYTARKSLREKGRALITRLSELPESERELEIERLTKELYDLGATIENRKLRLEGVNNIADVVSAIGDLSVLPVKSMFGLLLALLKYARSIEAADDFVDYLETSIKQKMGINDDMDFLSKIERVAELS